MSKTLSKSKTSPGRAPANPTKAKKTSLVARKGTATLSTIRDLQDQEKSTHGKALNTSKKYAVYVKRGREWLEEHFDACDPGEDPLTTHADEIGTPPDGDSPYDDPEFRNTFETIPNKYSDKALALFISYRCFQDGLGLSTADGAHAAFKHLWKNA